jgi:hypothetical protein
MSQLDAPYQSDGPYLFVSYSHADEIDVYREIAWLQEQGFNIWWDEGIHGGTRWRDELAERINGCQLFLLYVSPHSAESTVCREELEYALTHDRHVLLTYLAETTLPSGIDLAVANRQALLRYEMTEAAYEAKLLTSIARALDLASPTPRSRLTFRASRKSLAIPLTGLIAVILSISATWWMMQPPADKPKPTGQFFVPLTFPVAFAGSTHLAINGAGTHIYVLSGDLYATNTKVFARPLDSVEFAVVEGIQLGGDLIGIFPSQDGETLALALRDGSLHRVSADGGSPVLIGATGNNGFSFHGRWADDESILVSDQGKIVRFTIASGAAEVLVEAEARFPYQHPRGHAVLFTDATPNEPNQVAVKALPDGKPKRLVEGSDPRVTIDDQLLFFRDGAVWAARLSSDGFNLLSDPVRVLEEMAAIGGRAVYEFADTGTMVYQPVSRTEMDVYWVSREGLQKRVDLPRQQITDVMLAPSGKQFAYASGTELWLYDFESRVPTRIVDGKPQVVGPLWLTENELIYSSFTFTSNALNIVDVRTGQSESLLVPDRSVRAVSVIARENALIVQLCTSFTRACDIGILPLADSTTPDLVLNSSANERDPQLSPDGRFLAYSTDEFGSQRIVIRPWPDVNREYRVVPVDDCTRSEWSETDAELFLDCADGRYAVPYSADPFYLGEPMLLYNKSGAQFIGRYSSSRRQFLSVEASNTNNYVMVVLNWFDEIERLIEDRR